MKKSPELQFESARSNFHCHPTNFGQRSDVKKMYLVVCIRKWYNIVSYSTNSNCRMSDELHRESNDQRNNDVMLNSMISMNRLTSLWIKFKRNILV